MPHGVCPELVAEQGISGLCARSFHSSLPFSASVARMIFAGSTVCFVLASLNYPEPFRVMFGRCAGDMEEISWEYLSTAVGNSDRDDGGLSMMLKMTRLDDLGLGQLLFS